MNGTNKVKSEWDRVLRDQLGNNILMNTPMGKSAFACGAAFVVGELMKNWKKKNLSEIYNDLKEFCDDYMLDG